MRRKNQDESPGFRIQRNPKGGIMGSQAERMISLALKALYNEYDRIGRQIASLEKVLRGTAKDVVPRYSTAPKRRLSPAGRKAISEGMKRRWAQRRATAKSKLTRQLTRPK